MRHGAKRGRRARPAVVGLEDRCLLTSISATASGTTQDPPYARVTARENGVPLADRQLVYTTPQGTHVTVSLYGPGSLAGSTVDANGVLNLVYSGTSSGSKILGIVSGGTRRAPLGSILPATIAPGNLSGIGASPIKAVKLSDFDLVPGGKINLTAGVEILQLDAVGANTQVNLRNLPSAVVTGSSSSGTENGVTLTYSSDQAGGQTLVSVSGVFTAGGNLPLEHTAPDGLPVVGAPPAPPGAIVIIQHVDGPATGSSGLPDPEVFGIDPTADALVRFDAVTGQPLGTISLPAQATPYTSVALARDNGTLVVLVGGGTNILAYNAVTGAPVGGFSIADLAAQGSGVTQVGGLGSTDVETVVEDTTTGAAQVIDVTASLASGDAVALGKSFTAMREFGLSGGLTGLPGSEVIYAAGAAHFDSFQPNMTQGGFLTLNTAGGQLSESARTALKQNGNYIDTTPSAFATGMGSVDSNLAVLTGAANGQNTVALYNANLLHVGTLDLNYAGALADLSESFRPTLAGLALIDVQGNVQSFRAQDTTGMFLNIMGNTNLLQIHNPVDSTIVAEPLSHVAFHTRQDVTLVSSKRDVGSRSGVIVIPGFSPLGPLSLPS